MRRINLLPISQRRPEIPYASVSCFFVIVVMVMMIAIYGINEYFVYSLQEEQVILQGRYEELLPVKRAMDQAGQRQKQIDAKMTLINALAKSRIAPYDLIPRIAGLLTETTWINETKANNEDAKVVTLIGETVDYTELGTFVRRLEEDPLFSRVTLKTTDGDTKAGTLKFTLDIKLKEI